MRATCESQEQAYLEMPSLYALVLFSCFYSDSRWYKSELKVRYAVMLRFLLFFHYLEYTYTFCHSRNMVLKKNQQTSPKTDLTFFWFSIVAIMNQLNCFRLVSNWVDLGIFSQNFWLIRKTRRLNTFCTHKKMWIL